MTKARIEAMQLVVRTIHDADGLNAYSVDEVVGKIERQPVGEVYVAEGMGPGADRDKAEARCFAMLFAAAPQMAVLLGRMQCFCPVDAQDQIRSVLRAAGLYDE